MNRSSTHATPTDIAARSGSMSTEEIKARIEAMFARDENDPDSRSR